MIVSVYFARSYRTYDYNCKDTEVKAGTFVVVDSPREGYVVVKVDKVREGHGDNLKQVVCRVDDKQYRHDMMID